MNSPSLTSLALRRTTGSAPSTGGLAQAGSGTAPEQTLRQFSCTWRRPWYDSGRARVGTSRAYEWCKRGIDVVVALAVLPFALPVIGACMLLIKLDSPGPALIGQPRTGKGGRQFRMLKLRTMVPNAHELRDRYMHLNEHSYPDFKISNDPRVTRSGRILRKLSLDELPQVINVLRGDMTLVGPRPTSFGPETYRLWHTARLDVKPGLTGLWQVSGRSDVDFDDRLRLDIAYIRNRSLWLDTRILLRTVGAVISRKGAN
jgi:lipopolysaccharide/colanic/teichoic acid biosynthesis glycosyltransferase